MKEIPNFPGYFATSSGGIYSLKSKRHMRPKTNRNGYLELVLRQNGKSVTCRVHRLVAAAFHGVSEMQVNHIDGCKEHNNPENLEYVTANENKRHASEVLKRGHKPVALELDGEIWFWESHKACIKDTGLSQQEVSSLATGKRKSAKGWRSPTMFNQM